MLKDKEKFVNLETEADDLAVDSSEKKQDLFVVDQEIKVTPTGFEKYGVFCDCGNGWNGLVHISKITPDFVQNVSDYFTVGKPFNAKIIEVDETNKRLKLSTKEFNLKAENMKK